MGNFGMKLILMAYKSKFHSVDPNRKISTQNDQLDPFDLRKLKSIDQTCLKIFNLNQNET